MRHWKPRSAHGRWMALGLLILALGGVTLAVVDLIRRLSGSPETWQIDIGALGWLLLLIGSLLAALWSAHRLMSALTLTYDIDRNGLYIRWAGNQVIIPLDRIITIDVGAGPVFLPFGPFQRVGTYWGRAFTGEAPLYLYATQPPGECLIIYTADAAYALSPEDPDAFVQDLEQRRSLGATKVLQPSLEHSRVFHYAFWRDRTVLALVLAAMMINLLAFGLVAVAYPSLAPLVEMRFDATGELAELRPRHQTLFLPLAAFGLSLLNTTAGLALYRSLPLGARLLQGASVIVQLLFLVAVVQILW
ncbi:PH domain-containing protein [Roseiflexus castenholzii]|nr:PH domain-containing protein [Roseiflexus castenholzii]